MVNATRSRKPRRGAGRRLSRSPRIPRETEATVIALASSSDAEVRKAAVGVLARIPGREARSALVGLLRDSEPAVRERTVAVIGALRMGDAANALRPLLGDAVESVALAATAAMARLGDDPALFSLIEILQSDKATAKLAARAFGDAVGQRFAANAEGLASARRYVQASPRYRKAVGAGTAG